jgi:hypothetical protein
MTRHRRGESHPLHQQYVPFLLRHGDGDVTTELRRHKATHIVTTPHIAYGWRWSNQYLTTIKRRLIGGFPQARLADVINRTRSTSPGNRRTTQFFYKSDLSLSMTLKTEEDIFFRWSCILYIQERINEICGSRIYACVSLALQLFICIHSVFDQTTWK